LLYLRELKELSSLYFDYEAVSIDDTHVEDDNSAGEEEAERAKHYNLL